jgi:hypothetical protein
MRLLILLITLHYLTAGTMAKRMHFYTRVKNLYTFIARAMILDKNDVFAL